MTQPSENCYGLKIANPSEVTMPFKVSTNDYLPPNSTFFKSFKVFYIHYKACKDYKTTQNLLIHNAHNKTTIFMMISMWTNPTVIFILIGARMTEQSQVKYELLFCARVLLGNIRRIILLNNLGYWNAYQR